MIPVTDGIVIEITPNKKYVDLGDSITFHYSITGGNGDYTVSTYFEIITQDPNNWFVYNQQTFYSSEKDITITPPTGDYLNFTVSVTDSNGVLGLESIGRISLFIPPCHTSSSVEEERYSYSFSSTK